MILIQSDSNDVSTHEVMDWIYYLDPGSQVQRVNDLQEITALSYRINDTDSKLELKATDRSFQTDSCKAWWYRRGILSKDLLVRNSLHAQLGWEAQYHLQCELDYVLHALNQNLQDRHKGINKAQDNNTNKVRNLELARAAGIQIPDTLICTRPEDLYSFLRVHGKVISKPVCQGWTSFKSDQETRVHITAGTHLLQEGDIPDLQRRLRRVPQFLPSLFQQYIDKLFELRIFYFMGQCYPMAIFSQQNEQTKIDFRNYDYVRPNRCVPYILPKELADRIHVFMQSADLNCGSLDIVVTPQHEYIFLEVNPIGQFQWLDRHCNYYLTRQIAEYLVKHNNC